MMTLTEMQRKEEKRLVILNTVDQAGKFGMVFDQSSYVTRAEIEELIHEKLLLRTTRGGDARHFLTEKGVLVLRKIRGKNGK